MVDIIISTPAQAPYITVSSTTLAVMLSSYSLLVSSRYLGSVPNPRTQEPCGQKRTLCAKYEPPTLVILTISPTLPNSGNSA